MALTNLYEIEHKNNIFLIKSSIGECLLGDVILQRNIFPNCELQFIDNICHPLVLTETITNENKDNIAKEIFAVLEICLPYLETEEEFENYDKKCDT
jgi:hypothetical protein